MRAAISVGILLLLKFDSGANETSGVKLGGGLKKHTGRQKLCPVLLDCCMLALELDKQLGQCLARKVSAFFQCTWKNLLIRTIPKFMLGPSRMARFVPLGRCM